jgi:hypothetical protein
LDEAERHLSENGGQVKADCGETRYEVTAWDERI